jgi:hypothetical protein
MLLFREGRHVERREGEVVVMVRDGKYERAGEASKTVLTPT